MHHYDGPHHHRSHPAAEVLQQNQTVSIDRALSFDVFQPLWDCGSWKMCLCSVMEIEGGDICLDLDSDHVFQCLTKKKDIQIKACEKSVSTS